MTIESGNFNVEQTLTCGQVFRFERSGEGWWLHSGYRKIFLTQISPFVTQIENASKGDEGFWRNYFDMDTDYAAIIDTLTANDFVMRDAAEYGRGIRLLNQEPWECLISFIVSQNNNIKRIQKIINRLCERFGEELGGHRAFPTPEALSRAETDELMACGTGFRAKYISDAAKRVRDGRLDLSAAGALNDDALREKLKEIYGVGDKVADCASLFAFGRRASFPVDVWVKRVMERFYFQGTETPKEAIQQLAKARFGELGGYAQQYLFHYIRHLDTSVS